MWITLALSESKKGAFDIELTREVMCKFREASHRIYLILKFIEIALLGNFISDAYCLAETIICALRVHRRSQKLSTEQRMSSGGGGGIAPYCIDLL